MNASFRKNKDPHYLFMCPTILDPEPIKRAIGRRIPRCIEHNKAMSFTIICGDEKVGQGMEYELRRSFVTKIQIVPRDTMKPSKLRGDVGTGPVIHGWIEKSELPQVYEKMKIQPPAGMQVVQSKPVKKKTST